MNKKQKKEENKILGMILVVIAVVVILMAGIYLYSQAQNTFIYKNIKFQKNKIGELTFYETRTLALASDGTLFGFRLRTKPDVLKNIPFENSSDLRLMKVNGYTYDSNDTFNCEGDGVIAIANLEDFLKNKE